MLGSIWHHYKVLSTDQSKAGKIYFKESFRMVYVLHPLSEETFISVSVGKHLHYKTS